MQPGICPVCHQKPSIMCDISPDFIVQNFIAKGLESIDTINGLHSLNVEMPQSFVDDVGSKLWTSLMLDRAWSLHIREADKLQKAINRHVEHIGQLKSGLED